MASSFSSYGRWAKGDGGNFDRSTGIVASGGCNTVETQMVYVFLLRFQALCAESEVEEIRSELARRLRFIAGKQSRQGNCPMEKALRAPNTEPL